MFKNHMFTDSANDYVLIEEWQKTKDPNILNNIMDRHINLIKSMAHKYANNNIQYKELLSEGIVGFMHALEKFDIKKNVKFSTYLYYWIRWKVSEAIWHIKHMIQISHSAIHRIIEKMLLKIRNDEITTDKAIEDIAKKTKLSQKAIREKMKELSIHMVNMSNKLYYSDHQENNLAWENIIENHDYEKILKDEENVSTMKEINNIISKLSDRHQYIIEHKWLLQDRNFASLSEDLNISQERVRQLEKEAINFIKQKVKEKNITFSFMSFISIYMIYSIKSC